MNVILNSAPLRRPLTGIGRYTSELAQGLEAHRDIERVLHFLRFGFADARPVPPNAGGAVAMGWPGWIKRLPLADRTYNALRGASFALQVRRRAPAGAVYHEPNYLLMPYDGPTVVTIHDLSHLRYPQFHPKERVLRLERGLPGTLARASHVLTVSEFVRREIISVLGVAPERVTAIPLAADGTFHPRPRTECEEALRRYGLAGTEYLLSVATLEPRKNVQGLVEAHGRLPQALRARFPLAIAGPKGWLTGEMERRLSAPLRRGEVRLLGYVSSPELPLLYAAAAGFAFPSFYEGFGLPVVEALASGVPVLASDRASLPEVLGDAGLQVDPESVEAMTAGLERLLADEEFRKNSRESGPLQARRFSWPAFVDRTVEVYRRVAA